MKRNILIYILLLCSISIFAQGVVTPPRTCTVCKVTKPASEFSGDSKTCKACAKKKPETRTCSSCKKTKALNSFSGGSKVCKECATPKSKTCSVCQRNKPVVDFSRNSNECKECESIRVNREQAEKERIASEQEEKEREDREGVDWGLRGGTRWAIRNVGANSPEDYGDYFAWGETKGYKSGKCDFSWSTYKWCNGDYDKQTKYCNESTFGNNGFIDNKIELDPKDDAANVNWGNDWRMPSLEQIGELLARCKWESTMLNGVHGQKVTGPNGNSIFLPAAGRYYGTSLDYAGSTGNYWSRSLYTVHTGYAYDLYITSGKNIMDWGNYYRYHGLSVRPIRLKEETIEQKRIADKQDELNGYVNLGLPSGTLWATRNIGASKPEEYGDYFEWGETIGQKRGKPNSGWKTYKWSKRNGTQLKYTIEDKKKELDFEDDAAYVNWGSEWCMPNQEQFEELINHCFWVKEKLNGVVGLKGIGPNGNSIFLPLSGLIYPDHKATSNDGHWGYYWSRTTNNTKKYETYACSFHVTEKKVYYKRVHRCWSLSIRPVRR